MKARESDGGHFNIKHLLLSFICSKNILQQETTKAAQMIIFIIG